MKDQIIEKIKKYLDFVATETFSQPGRFTNEDIDKIKSLGYDIRHYSYSSLKPQQSKQFCFDRSSG